MATNVIDKVQIVSDGTTTERLIHINSDHVDVASTASPAANSLTYKLNEISSDIPTKTSDLTNDSNFVSDANYVHTDNNYSDTDAAAVAALGTAAEKDVPVSGDAGTTEVVMGNDSRLTDARNAADVSAWAKESIKPTYTASEVGAVATSAVGTASGVAELDENGKVPSAQLPSFVDDVVEGYYDSTTDRFYEEAVHTTVITPVEGKLWVDKTENKSYRWTGSVYVRTDEGVQIGETSDTAYRGDRGKTAYDHSQSDHSIITPAFTEASTRTNLTSGDSIATLFGKIKKWFSDLSDGTISLGHKIKNLSGTTLTDRTNLQFKGGLNATDDSVNDTTIIDDTYEEIPWSTWSGYTDAQKAQHPNAIITGAPDSDIDSKANKNDLTNISITGSTNNSGSTIVKGTYFYLNDELVRAKIDIAVNATLTSGTNYEAVTAGGLNQINSNLSDKANTSQAISNITRDGTTFTATKADNTSFTFTQQNIAFSVTTYNAGTYTFQPGGTATAWGHTWNEAGWTPIMHTIYYNNSLQVKIGTETVSYGSGTVTVGGFGTSTASASVSSNIIVKVLWFKYV